MYYENKIAALSDLFGTDVTVEENAVRVGPKIYPIVHDVIILTDPAHYTPMVKKNIASFLPLIGGIAAGKNAFAEDIQFTFGEEWRTYSTILLEHTKEFNEYFDLVNLTELSQSRVCDLGCGMGRWSYFMKNYCKEVVLVDFSDAIFVARQNLSKASNALFFMCDLKQLPFRENFADFLFCLGVLHHLPTPCLEEVRRLKWSAPRLLIFLYYALDNRPGYFQILLKGVTGLRQMFSRVRNAAFRQFVVWAGTWLLYLPLITLGRMLQRVGVGAGRLVPLYEYYHDKSLQRIEQDVYDRFFTRIEQRVTREDILGLQDTFRRVTVSDHFPYWHFTCER